CEPEGFSRTTSLPDRPDVLARSTVSITADKSAYPVLLSNGNLVAHGELASDAGRLKRYAKWRDPFPKPSYLFAQVAGDLVSIDDEFRTMSGRHVELKIFSIPANL